MSMDWSTRVTRLRALKMKVAALSERIGRLEEAALPSVTRADAVRGGRGRVSDPVGDAAVRLADEKDALVALRRCVMEEIGAVYDFIDAAPEARNVRTILRLRYIEDVGWAEIARRLGESRRSTVLMRAKRYLAAADKEEPAPRLSSCTPLHAATSFPQKQKSTAEAVPHPKTEDLTRPRVQILP